MSAEPQRRTYEVVFWDCGKGHRHSLRDVARRCMAKPGRKVAIPVASRKVAKRTRAELQALAERYLAGERISDLATELKLTRAHVAHILDVWAAEIVVPDKGYGSDWRPFWKARDKFRALPIKTRFRAALAVVDSPLDVDLYPGQSAWTARAYLEAIARP